MTSFTQRVKGNDGRMDLPTLTISASEGWLNQKDRFSANIAGSEQKNYTLLRQGELSYNHGNSKLAKYGVVYALQEYKEALVPRVYHSFKVDESYDALFVEYYFSTKRPDRELRKLISSGARMDGLLNIGYDEFTNISISLPTFSEQKQIVALLKVCVKNITVHQRKIEHLNLKKKVLLQKLFPKNGECYPEHRFPGFTDAWEQRKLGDLIFLNGRIGFRGYTEADIVSKDEGGVLTFSPTNIVDNRITIKCKNTYITRLKYDESPEIKVYNGDILFVKTGSTLGKSALVKDIFEDATLNPQVVVMRPNNLSSEFLSIMMLTDNILSQVRKSRIGGAVPTLTESTIKAFDTFIPENNEEAQKIGKIFGCLDDVITLHQRKLEHLQLQKKALLQQLFI